MGQRRVKKQARKTRKKKASERTDWKELEIIIARIQKELAPNATITHNDFIVGRSGRRRQLDVTLKENIGKIPILIVVECKRYSRVVGIDKVEQFAKKLEDVRASRGVMVSNTGFDAGAKAVAQQNNILFRTYREAEETDWSRMISTVSVALHDFDIVDAKGLLKLNTIDAPLQALIGTRVFSENGQDYDAPRTNDCTIKTLFWKCWEEKLTRPRPLGYLEVRLDQFSPPAFVKTDGGLLLQVEYILLKGTITVEEFTVPLRLVTGEVLEDSETKKLDYLSATTASFNFSEIREKYKGIQLSQEQWENLERSGKDGFVPEEQGVYRFTFIGGEE